jgi:endonuclease III
MAGADAKKLHALLKHLVHEAKERDGGTLAWDAAIESSDRFDAAVHELVLGVLMHHTTLAAAQACQKRLRAWFVDLNELRVASPKDIALAMGERPGQHRDERALRIHAMLADISGREGELSLETLRGKKGTEQRDGLLALDGVTPFAALRVLGLHFGQALVAVDDRALHALREQAIVGPKGSEHQAGQHLATVARQLEPGLGLGHLQRLFRELGERTALPRLAAVPPAAVRPASEKPAPVKTGRVNAGPAKPTLLKPSSPKPSASVAAPRSAGNAPKKAKPASEGTTGYVAPRAKLAPRRKA